MTLDVNYATDLEVRSDRTQIDRAFFNRRFKALYDELARLDADFAGFGDTENTLVQLGLERLNETLGPLLTTLQEAAELGFLICYSVGDNHSLVLGEFVPWHITEGATLFTPTPFVLAMDMTDSTNWGILQIDEDGWHPTTGEMSTHVAYAAKTQSSTQWSISASSAMMPAMQQILDQANNAKASCVAADASVTAQMTELQDLIDALQSGAGVAKVNDRSGLVVLTEADIPALTSNLAAKASITYVNTQTAGKQNQSAKLDTLINLTWAANKILYATGAATLSTLDVSDYAKTLLDDANLGAAQTTLGISAFAKTLIDDADAATARTTLGIAAAPDIPVKASTAEVITGTDDAKFVTALGAASQYLPRTAQVTSQAATGYTLVGADHGNIIRFTSSSAVTCYLPASAQVGFNALIEQFGTGQVTINVAVNATRRSFGSRFKLAGQYAVASVFCEANSDGSHAEWNVNGNLVV